MEIHYGNATPAQRRFIERRIAENLLACQTGLVNELLTLEKPVSGISIDDIRYPDVTTADRWDAAGPAQRRAILADCNYPEDFAGLTWEEIAAQQEDTANLEQTLADEIDLDPPEILEWWLVSDYIARRLQDIGEAVLYAPGLGFWWGRTCSGQAVALDPTWWTLYADALEGVRDE